MTFFDPESSLYPHMHTDTSAANRSGMQSPLQKS